MGVQQGEVEGITIQRGWQEQDEKKHGEKTTAFLASNPTRDSNIQNQPIAAVTSEANVTSLSRTAFRSPRGATLPISLIRPGAYPLGGCPIRPRRTVLSSSARICPCVCPCARPRRSGVDRVSTRLGCFDGLSNVSTPGGGRPCAHARERVG
jgi:hypothetical protein